MRRASAARTRRARPRSPAFTSMLTWRYPAAHGVRALRGAAPARRRALRRRGAPPTPATGRGASVTGPLLDSIGLFRGLPGRRLPRRAAPLRPLRVGQGRRRGRSASSRPASGPSSRSSTSGTRIRRARTRARSSSIARYGKNAYERSLAGIDAWVGADARGGRATAVVILTGDHGENLFLEPFGLRWQGLARRITRRLPMQRLSLELLERGRAQRVEAAAPPRSALLLEPQPDAAPSRSCSVPLAFAGPGMARESERSR